MSTSLNSVFADIYAKNLWGHGNSASRKNKKFYSGGGSELENDRDAGYVKLVQSYVDRPDVNTVVEIGCGDWEIGTRINWGKVHYTGYDVVEEVVRYNQDNFSSANVMFACANLIPTDDVQADLLIVKDVFQHLPPSYCARFVRRIPLNFKYNLITNDRGGNTEITPGGYSGNDFSAMPFRMKYDLLIQWVQVCPAAGNKQTVTMIGAL